MNELEKFSDAELRAEIMRREPEPPPARCSKCQTSIDDEPDNYLVEVQVIVADGEEGFAHVIMWLCGECDGRIFSELKEMGFVDHRHGGINFLEAEDCGGYGKCLTPTEYGKVYVGNYEFNQL